MLPDPVTLLKILCLAAVPLIAAGILFWKGKAAGGLLLGLILLGALELFAFRSMDSSTQTCIRETCLAAGRAPDCEPYLGCGEGNGMLSLLYKGAAVIDVLLLAAAALAVSLPRRASSPPAEGEKQV